MNKLREALDVSGGDISGLDAADIEDIFAEVPSSEIGAAALAAIPVRGIAAVLDRMAP